jgi:hypothetical protein
MTNAIHKVAEYIRSNREGARGRNHSGIELLNRHVDYGVDYEELVIAAVQAAQSVFLKSRRAHGKPFKLTATSSAIGLAVVSRIGLTNSTYTELFCVGDLFVEAFIILGYMELEREYEGYRAPYVIYLTDTWEELGDIPPAYEGSTLTGTSFRKFPRITGLRNPITKRPYIKRMTSERDFNQCLDEPFVKALDKLQRVPWRLNTTLVKAMRDNVSKFVDMKDSSDKGKSKRIEMKFVLNKANAIGDQTFYQAVECDYRGRVYYTESFLNFQGSDIAKGLFEFDEGKRLGPRGYYWLCIHTACSYNKSYTLDELETMPWLSKDYKAHLEEEGLDTISVDKMTLDDRAQWTLKNINMILDSAKNLEFKMDAEKPVTLLACALDLKGYLDTGEDYKSHLPIPVDGSNNGWQHLAAMSKDKQAGELVSLVPQEIQKDFYVQVAKRLIKRMPDWFAERNMPMKCIRKGIAKRGSMTRAYSAGQRKIAENMYHDCKVEGYHKKYKVTKEDCELLARNLILAINDTCVGPLKTMKFLQKVTNFIIESGETCLQWTTPSGFPVLYEVWKQKNMTFRSTIRTVGRIGHSVKIPVTTKEGNRIPCRRSFASGCSPNFVHSMDAAHMAKVIEAFPGTFGAIHDSFSTHACDIDKLVEHTKWQFAMLYNVNNFFDRIQSMLIENFKGYSVQQPELGTLKVEEVVSSDYFFS